MVVTGGADMNSMMARLFILTIIIAAQRAMGQDNYPAQVPQPDGTVLLQYPRGTTAFPYIVAPDRCFSLSIHSSQATENAVGKTINGSKCWMGSIVEAEIMVNGEFPMTIVNGMIQPSPATSQYQIFRSADIIVTWDHTRLKLLDFTAHPFLTDKTVFDISKAGFTAMELSGGVNEAPVPSDGTAMIHAEVKAAPSPMARSDYYKWLYGGFLWQGNGRRCLGRLRFVVVSDFHYPVQQTTDIKIAPSVVVADGTVAVSRIDGSMESGRNMIGSISNAANKIMSAPSPAYKVGLWLIPPSEPVDAGETFEVSVMANPETLPQYISSVNLPFAWDTNHLEFVGVNTFGAKPSMSNGIDFICPTCINESGIPKDGTANLNWLCRLGDKNPIDRVTLIAKLKFKCVVPFQQTTIEILKDGDVRLSQTKVLNKMGILGSCVAGSYVTGEVKNAIVSGSGS
jgi:hypothetical protein